LHKDRRPPMLQKKSFNVPRRSTCLSVEHLNPAKWWLNGITSSKTFEK
jgi:hypothetical protein